MPVKVLIADDHKIFLAGLRALLYSNDEIEVVGEAGNGQEAIDLQKQLKPDIIVMDINMPGINGIEATREITTEFPGTKVLALSIHSGKRFVKGMLEAGASGYLLKDSAPDELVTAIQKIMKGEMYLSSTITKIALEKEEPAIKETEYNILITKLHRPPISDDIIQRDKIIEMLEKNINKPLTLVSAPAGYGKSMTISQWLEKTKARHSWISLDEEHNDTRTFLLYFTKAITGIFPEALQNLTANLKEIELPSTEKLTNILINELDQIEEDFILVLDDYHQIKSDGIHQLINAILRYPPQQMHLVLLTRRDPSLQLKELRVHARLTELRMQDLAFTVPEIMCLFRQSHGIELTEHTAKTIHSKTEGWIVGLRLASLAIKNPEDTEVVLAKLKSDFFTSSDFLMEEVMQNQSPEIQKLLLATSLCNRFCSELVDNIRQKGDMTLKSMTGDEFIQWLKTSNLFLISLDFDNKWYRYHHLFQELLIKQLNNRSSAHEVNEIQRQIAQWHESRDDIDEAIEYFCLAGDAVAAAEIVEKKAHDVFLHGVYLVETWLMKIPQNIKETRPLLLLIEAWHAFGQFQLEKIPPILEKVQSIVNKDNDSPRLQAEISFFQGNFMYWMGETESSIQMLSNALNIADGLPTHVKSNIELVLNLALQKSGHYETVVKELQRKIHATEKSEGFYLSYVYGSLTFVHFLQGKLPAAADAAYKMQINSSKIKSNYLLGWAYYLHASADFSTFKLKESLALFTLARAYRYSIDLRVTLDAMASSALIHYFYHDQKQSFQILKELTDYTAELNDPPSMLIAQSAKARLDLLTGNNNNAIQWAETFTMPPMFAGIFFWMEVPWITKAKILIAKGNADSLEIVLALLQELLELVVSSNLDYHKVEILMLLAITHEKLKHTDEALKYIEQAVSLADKQVCVRPFIEAEKSLQLLLIKLSEQGTATEFIEKLLSLRSNMDNKTNPLSIPEDDQSPVDSGITLTEREQETLVLLAEGLRNKEIANKLFVSESTIKRHVYNMCQKLNIKSRVELINKAKAMGFFN